MTGGIVAIVRTDRGSGHSYAIDGRPADGVTTLIGEGLSKPALIGWAANVTAGYAVDHWDELAALTVSARLDTLKRARFDSNKRGTVRGTQVHELAALLVGGIEVEVPEALAGHVESYVKFLNEWQVDPVLIETVIAHRQAGYCGTLDLVARMRGQMWLCDVKTADSGVWPETALQLAAYAHATSYLDADGEEHDMIPVDRGAAIWVRADGYDVIPVRIDDQVFNAFRHVAWVARSMREAKSWLGQAIA
jgi:hypothetical protein